jgi:arylsulfatase A-like enzyme
MKTSNWLIWLVLPVLSFQCSQKNSTEDKVERDLNVLFIAVDDLRPELGSYGVEDVFCPNIDKLANGGIQFNQAYCNIPVCGASRASILTGLYPTLTRFVDHKTMAEIDAPNRTTLPELFKTNGYQTFSLGKVFHHKEDSPESWSSVPWQPAVPHLSKNYYYEDNLARQAHPDSVGPYFEIADIDDDYYVDGQIANKAIDMLDSLSATENPFFLAVGFLRPHLLFSVPKKYWDLYPEESVRVPDNRYWPVDAPEKKPYGFGEFKKYQFAPKEYPVPDSVVKTMNRGYRASVSYVDAMIGRVLDRLEKLELDKNTIIILWGDHGFHLGEHDLYCKHVTFTNTMQAPLIIKAPGFSPKKIRGMTEFVDIYPTLCELIDVKHPAGLQGNSLVPQMKDDLQGKEYIFSRFKTTVAVKDEQFLYVKFIDDKGNFVNEMLFDHIKDPEENQNIALQSDMQPTLARLRNVLENHEKEVYALPE